MLALREERKELTMNTVLIGPILRRISRLKGWITLINFQVTYNDGLKIFNAIEDFVQDVVNAFYKSGKEVKSDSELQNWAKDIHTNAFPSHFGEREGTISPAKSSQRRSSLSVALSLSSLAQLSMLPSTLASTRCMDTSQMLPSICIDLLPQYE